MNTETYNHLLKFSAALINKYPNIIIEKEDLVHDAWDFKESNLDVARGQISKLFYRDYIKDVSKVYLCEMKKKATKIEEIDKQCNNCKEVKPLALFSFDKNNNEHQNTCKRCKADAQNKLNATRKLASTDKTLEELLAEKKISIIKEALLATDGNKSLACKMLKIDRKTFYNIYKDMPKKEIKIKPFFEVLEEFKRDVIKQAIKKNGGNKTLASKQLNINRKTIWSNLKQAQS